MEGLSFLSEVTVPLLHEALGSVLSFPVRMTLGVEIFWLTQVTRITIHVALIFLL